MKKLKKLLIGIVNFGKVTRYSYSDGSVRFIIHENDKSEHRKYSQKFEDLCQ